MSLKAVIIDDVAQARATLREDLETYCPDVKIVGEAEGVVSGAKLLQQQEVDVVFLDIQMQDGSGFDLLEILPTPSFKVIFTTASDAFAIRAFRFSAIDYLLKPIDPDELIQAVEKVKALPGNASESLQLLADSIKEPGLPKRLALHTMEKIYVAEISEIIRCESSGNYTQFYFSNGEKLLVTRTLKEYDKLLENHGFVRVHQSHLVNTNHIKEYIKLEGGYLVMDDLSRVAVSVRKKAAVMKLLERL
ncbi:MAG: LytTR family DNA-binding domain-containing protein [Bacteroidota bacterium]